MTVAIHWFRKGLRLHDNLSLLEACKAADHVIPVFIVDPWFANPERVGVLRYRFLLESLRNLDTSLRGLRSRLVVIRGRPLEVFPRIIKDWGVSRLTFESDTEPYARERDTAVVAMARDLGVETLAFPTHTLYDPERLLAANRGACPTAYGTFTKLLEQAGAPERPLPPPHELPGLPESLSHGHPDEFDVPTLREMDYPEPLEPALFPGGEDEALRRMREHLARETWIAAFEKPQTIPNALAPSTTVLSPYLKFGCLSPRTFFWGLRDVLQRHPRHSLPPVSLVGQLYWREFFYLNGYAIRNFDKMVGNSVCRQIPWRQDGEDETERLLQAWEEGRTGYPFIDAIMTQLREEGWIHHLARHAVACFLTRGDLWVSWERGAAVFDKYLLDADWSINNGNWMWLSASAYFYQFFRVYSPVAFGKKTDKSGAYIRKYLPQLARMPDKYIYEPWKAPLTAQHAAGCIIGKDYPRPIVDHDSASERNKQLMKEAYDRHNQQEESRKRPRAAADVAAQ